MYANVCGDVDEKSAMRKLLQRLHITLLSFYDRFVWLRFIFLT